MVLWFDNSSMGTDETDSTDGSLTEERKPDPDGSHNHEMSDEDRGILQSVRLANALLKDGYDDPMVLTWENAKEVMTEKRLEILEAIGTDTAFESHRDLARHLDRDIGQVQRDLDLLYDRGILEREAGVGTGTKPELSMGTLVVSPLMVDNEHLPAAANFTAHTGDESEDRTKDEDEAVSNAGNGETTT